MKYQLDQQLLKEVAGGNPADEVAKHAHQQLLHKISQAVQEAHAQGLDFVHSPVQVNVPDPFAPLSLFDPVRHEISVRGGPVEPGQEWPADWTVYRCPQVQP